MFQITANYVNSPLPHPSAKSRDEVEKEKENMMSDIKLYYVMIGGRKNIVFYKVVIFCITDAVFHYYHSLLEVYNLNVYQKSDWETNKAFWKSLKLETL